MSEQPKWTDLFGIDPDFTWSDDADDDLRARLEIAEASVHVLTELLYRVARVLTPAQMAILGLPGGLSRPVGVGAGSGATEGGERP